MKRRRERAAMPKREFRKGVSQISAARQKASWAGSSSRGGLFEAGLLPAVGLLVGDSESPVSSVQSVQSSQFSPDSSVQSVQSSQSSPCAASRKNR